MKTAYYLLGLLLVGNPTIIICKVRPSLKNCYIRKAQKTLTAQEITAIERWLDQLKKKKSCSSDLLQDLIQHYEQRQYLVILRTISQDHDTFKDFPITDARFAYLTDQLDKQSSYIQAIGKLAEKQFQHISEKITHLIDLTMQLSADFNKKMHKEAPLLPLIKTLLFHCKSVVSYSDKESQKKLKQCIILLSRMAHLVIQDNPVLYKTRR